MGDEIFSALADPAQITDTQLPVTQRRGDGQPCGISQRLRTGRSGRRVHGRQALCTQRLGARQVQAQQVAAIIRHHLILTRIGLMGTRRILCTAGDATIGCGRQPDGGSRCTGRYNKMPT